MQKITEIGGKLKNLEQFESCGLKTSRRWMAADDPVKVETNCKVVFLKEKYNYIWYLN